MTCEPMIEIDLSPSRFLGYTAGLRPFRAPTPRLELEMLGNRLVAHNYGHGGSGITMCWGAAQEVLHLLRPHLTDSSSIAVLGAGVMGLCAATLLTRAGYRVRIYTRELPALTTSRVAGGLWAPTHVGAGATPELAQQHDRILRHTWNAFKAMDPERFGVVEAPMYETDDRAYALDPMPEGLTPPPRRLESMPFPGALGPGQVSSTLLIETPKFLGELEKQLRDQGVEFVERTLGGLGDLRCGASTPRTVAPLGQDLEEEILVNCLGLGAREAFGDPQVVPIRGQLALFQPVGRSFMLDHSQGYVISRPDILILGGTFEEGMEDPQPVEAMIDKIVNKHRNVFNILAT